MNKPATFASHAFHVPAAGIGNVFIRPSNQNNEAIGTKTGEQHVNPYRWRCNSKYLQGLVSVLAIAQLSSFSCPQ